MKKLHYTLKDFKINYPDVVKITWNDKILYNDTLSYYDPLESSIETLTAVRLEYANKLVHNICINIQNKHGLILNVIGEN